MHRITGLNHVAERLRRQAGMHQNVKSLWFARGATRSERTAGRTLDGHQQGLAQIELDGARERCRVSNRFAVDGHDAVAGAYAGLVRRSLFDRAGHHRRPGRDVVGNQGADREEDDRQDGVDDRAGGQDQDPGETRLGPERARVDANGQAVDARLAPFVHELGALFLGGDQIAGRRAVILSITLWSQGQVPGGLSAVALHVVVRELAFFFAACAEDSVEELIRRHDAFAVDLEDAVAGDEVFLHSGVLIDRGDQQPGRLLAGQADEASDGQPVEGVQRFAELPALADPRGQSDAEFFHAHAGQLGGDEVPQFVQDDQSKQDADEG